MIRYRDLAYCEDEQFIWNCYNFILGRDPDPVGFVHHVNALRRGRSRPVIARSLLRSPEARLRGARVKGVHAAVLWIRLLKLPLVGSMLASIERINDAHNLSRAVLKIEMDASMLISIAQQHANSVTQGGGGRSNVAADEASSDLSPRGREIFEELRCRG